MNPRIASLIAILLVYPAYAAADERPYTEGPVWNLSMIRTADGMDDQYLESLGKTLKPIYDEAQKQGIILSYKIIRANAGSPDDWNILIMVEYKNWAALDGLTERSEAIQRKVWSRQQEADVMQKRLSVRRFIADKNGQELILK